MTTPANTPSEGSASDASQVDYRILKSVDTYTEAQALVDGLSDDGFPVDKVRIVGTGLRTVEQVLTRMTTGKAAGRGALGGLWFGLLIGLLFAILAPPIGWLPMLLISLGLGAVWGAIFGAIGHASTGGRRDFASVSTMEAETYDVMVEATHIARAAEMALGGTPPPQRSGADDQR